MIATLEIARAIGAIGGLDADVIFFIPSGEEDGLKGTEAFVADPTFDLTRVKAVIDFEFVGRPPRNDLFVLGGDDRTESLANPLYTRALEAQRAGLPLACGLLVDAGEGWWRRSNHRIFASTGAPSILIHGGRYDDYHSSSDVFETLSIRTRFA